jgi:hypothetical protein
MKKFIYMAVLLIGSALGGNAIAGQSDYNTSFQKSTEMFLLFQTPEEKRAYYLNAIKSCSLIQTSGATPVYNPRDARILSGGNKKECHKMLGVYDAYRGNYGLSSLSMCDREDIPSDVTRPNDIVVNNTCGFNAVAACSAKTFNKQIGTSNPIAITFTFLDGYPVGTKAIKSANQSGQSCGEDAHLECAMQANCQLDASSATASWSESTLSCACVSHKSTKVASSCSGTSPDDKPFCRCGNWVDWNTFSTTYACASD